ncbi:hypothetical protein FRD01_04815 [Microvenator marinus]|uniref:Uncharacterized protein n=1 Tax=Microvenator marinus TaxID=2600177 RepID=A0A5B8Y3N5_9DELT|nr:hypothetical protein FRD01_04815 [Microvenator marinus]
MWRHIDTESQRMGQRVCNPHWGHP